MTNLAYPRLTGAATVAAPVLLLGSTISYVSAGKGMNDGEAGGTIQVWAMIAFALVTVSLARLLERAAPRAAATLSVVGLIGAAGGVGYGIDSIQAAIFDTGSIQETDSAVAPLALQLPGVLFPLSLIGLGVMLARTGTVAPWSGWTLAAGALLFPLSRIPDVEALAVAADALLVIALVPLGLQMIRGAVSGQLPSDGRSNRAQPASARG
jgi:hypothetical protein